MSYPLQTKVQKNIFFLTKLPLIILPNMKIGLIGLGKMGANMTERLLIHQHDVVAFDLSESNVQTAVEKGAEGASSLEEVLTKLPSPKVVWLMVPAGKPVDQSIDQLLPHMSAGDIMIDGGNSFWRQSMARAEKTAEKGVKFIDCGVSGGVWGLKNGYCLMYGGEKEAVDHVEPIFKALAPENGYVHCGESGSGHLVKMVHNGIEYGMMQAYAEGFEILDKAPHEMDLTAISKVWMQGSVIRSWLLELIGKALEEDPRLDGITDFVQDSGEGRWTIQTAIDFAVPANAIAASLFARFESRQDQSFAMKLVAAMRNQFGGHAVVKSGE